MAKIIGIGNALVDVLVPLHDEGVLRQLGLPVGGMTLLDEHDFQKVYRHVALMTQQRATGGSASNTIHALSAVGDEVGFIGMTGDDEAGRFFAAQAHERGIDARLSVLPQQNTGTAFTFITPNGQRTFATHLGAAACMKPTLQTADLKDYDIIHVEGYLVQDHDLILHVLRTAKEAGLTVSFDLASWNIVRQDHDFLCQLVSDYVDIVFANEEEAAEFSEQDDPEEALWQLSRITRQAIVKVGSRGALGMNNSDTQGHHVFVPAQKQSQVKDTTAAGDFFAAGFLHRWARGASLSSCLDAGCRLAGEVIQVLGTQVSAERLRQALAVMAFLLAWLPGMGARAQQAGRSSFDVSRNLEIFADIYRQLDMFYVDILSADTAVMWAIDGMLGQIDPFTTYFSTENEDELRAMATGKYAGIGAVIRPYKKENRTAIEEPYEGCPAHEAGVRAGDIILTIDGKDTKGWGNQKVSQSLRGEPGTTFELRVRRPGHKKPLSFKITRRQIQTPPVPWYGMLDGHPGVGYIYLSSVTEQCSKVVRHAFTDLKRQGMQQLILDLRDNPGGAVSEAVEIVGMFVPKGSLVVSTKGKVAATCHDYRTPSEPLDTVMPIAVMVNGSSASAAEIISGALQDLDRATIFGQRTYGKGLVQAIREVPYRGQLKITTARYYIPSGRCIQAYDYRHRTADGAATALPDSLTREFRTRLGRIVRDGGGIQPDSILRVDSVPTAIYELLSSDALFDWVTDYVAQHPDVPPVKTFTLTDADYASFIEAIRTSDFSFANRSLSLLRSLRQMARAEGRLERSEAQFQALEEQLKQVDVATDLQHFRQYLQPHLEVEIMNRYLFQKGAMQKQVLQNKDIRRVAAFLEASR